LGCVCPETQGWQQKQKEKKKAGQTTLGSIKVQDYKKY
jgi:hypothetical protein